MKTTDGFNLIEILITLFIISILTMMSLPSLQHYLITLHRQKAEQVLSSLAVAMEEYQLAHGSYQDASLDTLKVSESKNDSHYVYSVTSDEAIYTLQAEPIGNQLAKDPCGRLTLNSIGEKIISGQMQLSNCW